MVSEYALGLPQSDKKFTLLNYHFADDIQIMYRDVLIANILDCAGYLFPEFTEADQVRQMCSNHNIYRIIGSL